MILRLRFEEAQRRYQDKLETHEKALAAWTDRKRKEEDALRWDWFEALLPIAVSGFVGWLAIPRFGFLLGGAAGIWFVNYFRDKQRRRFEKSFNAKFPEPNLPDMERPKPFDESTLELNTTGFAGSDTSNASRANILLRDRETCQSCGSHPPVEQLEVHHVQPQADGGPDIPLNLVTLCIECHDRETWFGHKRKFPTTLKFRV